MIANRFRIIIILLIMSGRFFAEQTPELGIIIPFFHNDPIERFLKEMIHQSFFGKSEFIFISNDATPEQTRIVSHFKNHFKNLQLIESKEFSDAQLYNAAIMQSNAPFLTVLGIGDYREPHHLELQLEVLKQTPIDLVYSDYWIIYENYGFGEAKRKWYFVPLPEFEPELLYRNIIGTHFIWKKSLHEHNGYFDESYRYLFFWEFWNRCVNHGALFKKVAGCAGNFFFNYFNPRKLFLDSHDHESAYKEDKAIRSTYQPLWEKTYNLPEKPFVIVCASYNNVIWHKRNLDSMLNQQYDNYRVIYINDQSSDATYECVKNYIAGHEKENKFTIINNEKRVGALKNIYNAIHTCKKEEIIVLLDGDDWFAHNNVLNHLNSIYQDQNVWLTYGQFQWYPNNMPGFAHEVPASVLCENKIRDYSWVTTHLRTFYAGLFQQINKADFIQHEETFYEMAWDLAIMYPAIEMAGIHAKFIDEVMYIYNTANVINDDKVDGRKQSNLGNEIRAKQRYQPIEHF